MKYIFIFLIFPFLIGCSSNLKIVTSKKQTVVPGLASQSNYLKYHFLLDVKKQTSITIDSIVVSNKEKCYKLPFSIAKKQGAKLLNSIDNKGFYKVEAVLKKHTAEALNCNLKKDSAVIYYKENDKSKTASSSGFVLEKITRR